MIDFTDLLSRLAYSRALFHSEADFQHALAWEMHISLPAAKLRLEYPVRELESRRFLDILLRIEDQEVAIELKYKTRGLVLQNRGESFNLKDQAAQPLGRYDFISDIWRIEQFVSARSKTQGFAIFLTNDSAYWRSRGSSTSIFREFSLDEGQQLSGTRKWTGAGPGTTRNREEPIELLGSYRLHWRDYSRPSGASYGRFRYLLVEVTGQRVKEHR